MDPQTLKDRFGDKITFWGGGIDTQKTLPFGTPDDVRREAAEANENFRPRRRIRFQFRAQHSSKNAGREPR